jgi:hypothetical protein
LGPSSPNGDDKKVESPPFIDLVGGFNPSEKYESVGNIIPNIWENKKCSKPARDDYPISTSIYRG